MSVPPGGRLAGVGSTLAPVTGVELLQREDAIWARAGAAAMLGTGLLLSRAAPGVGLPCPLRALTGIPCPLCGLQTSVKATLALDLGAALAASPAGVVAVVVALWMLVRPAAPIRVSLVALVAVAALMWAFQLHRFGLL